MTTPPYKFSTPAPTEPRQSHVYMLIFGPTDSGKSSLALTAPGPICYMHGGSKVEGLIQRASIDHIAEFGYPMAEYNYAYLKPSSNKSPHAYRYALEQAAALKWEGFKLAYEEALGNQEWCARTIIIDTERALYDLIRLSYFGGDRPDANYEKEYKNTNNVNRQDLWGRVNSDWYDVMRQMAKVQTPGDKGYTTNIILLTHAVDEWVDDKTTGELVPKSQSQIPFWVDVTVQTRIDKLDATRSKYYAKITKPWDNGSIRGKELEVTDNPESFEDIMFEITGDSDTWSE